MEFKETNIPGVIEFVPRKFEDVRGCFFETFTKKLFQEICPDVDFVQENESFSNKGVIRGLHFQKTPWAQGKLVRVVKGRVIDVALDIREGSATFGHHVAVELDDERSNMLYVPEGFAHGFSVLEDAVFQYKCTNYYNKESEGGLRFDDPELAINWRVSNPIISEKDLELPLLSDFKS